MDHDRRFTHAKIARRLELITRHVEQRSTPLGTLRYKAHAGPEAVPEVGVDVDDRDWLEVEPETYWGQWNTTFTLRGHLTVSAEWSQTEPVALQLDLGTVEQWDFCHPEALIYIDGTPLAGCDKYHRRVTLPAAACDGRRHLLALHGYTGRWGHFEPPPPQRLFLGKCRLLQIDSATRDLVATARVAVDTLKVLDRNSPTWSRILTALDRAFAALDTREPLDANFYATVPRAHQILRAGLRAAGPALDVDITAVGHTHIDVAWLWTLAQTRRKCGRSFHTVLDLMEQFEDYRFTQSQPQLYDYVRNDYPELFARIQTQVAQGRWEVTGGMWVEADCNLSGPESLVRQLLLGRQFFAEHFGPGVETPIAWLPDVFGFPHSLPQLLKQAGLEYFFTTKLSWNQYNRMPYDSFWWQGLDGTKILAHLGTTTEAGSDPTTVTLRNGENGYAGNVDSYIASGRASNNYGSSTSILADGSDGSNGRLMSVLKWDVSAIPGTATVDGASVTLQVFNRSSGTYKLYALTTAWSEGSVTYSGLDPLNNMGVEIGSFNPSSTGSKQVTLNAAGIALVQDWIDGSAANHGFIIMDASSTDGLDMRSSEYGTISQRPMLSVTYQ